MTDIVMATLNMGKIKEFEEILSNKKYNIIPLNSFKDVISIEETGTSFAENAILKATGYGQFSKKICIADDSGLAVDALNGAPGVYSARFAENDEDRCTKLLEMMKNVKEPDRTARFICAACLYLPAETVELLKNKYKGNPDYTFYENNPNIITTFGNLEGRIGFDKKGNNGFGFDPIMYIPSLDLNLAEVSSSKKNSISHRGQALSKIKILLDSIL